MALQGSQTEVVNSIRLSSGKELKAVATRNGDNVAKKRVIIASQGGGHFDVTNQDCRDLVELALWLEKA